MKTRFHLCSILPRLAVLLSCLVLATEMWGGEVSIYSTGFESTEGFTAGTNYQSTLTQGPSGNQWTISYGTTSTSNAITGSQSLAMRLYGTGNYGYAKTNWKLSKVTKIQFKAKASQKNPGVINLNVDYSSDGSNWTAMKTAEGGSTDFTNQSTETAWAWTQAYMPAAVSGQQDVFIRISISSASTRPSSGNIQLTIDEVTVYGEDGATATTLKYNINGGEGTTPSNVTSFPATLSNGSGFSRVGYVFAGWNTKEDGTGSDYAAGATGFSIDESTTLYAKWTAKTTAITLDLNDGNVGATNVTATYDQALPEFTLATRNETSTYQYRLAGYYITKTGGGDVKVINADGSLVASVSGYTDAAGKWIKEDATATLYARWDNYCKVEWVNNGTTVETTYVKQNETIGAEGMQADLTAGDACSATYNTFIGWYTEASGTESSPAASAPATKVTSETVVPAKVKYYAVWSNMSAGGATSDIVVDFKKSTSYPAGFPTETGTTSGTYNFAGFDFDMAVPTDVLKGGTTEDNYYLFLKGINTLNATIALPARSGYKLTKVTINTPTTAATTVAARIDDVTGGDQWTFVAANSHDFTLTGTAANTPYVLTIVKVSGSGSKNAQIAGLILQYTADVTASYISTCCASDVNVAITAEPAGPLALNIDGQATTTVSFVKTATNTIWMYEPTISPAEGASFSGWGSGTYKTANYNLTFTASQAGTYTITESALDKGLDCSKIFTKQIEVAANPILAASSASLTVNGQCGVAGTASSFTVNSRYLTSSKVTVSAATSTTTGGTYKVSKDGTTYSTSITFDGGIADKGTQTIYVRYEGVADESGAIAGNITISGGGATEQSITLSGSCSCGTYLTLTPVDGNATHITAPKDQWTQSRTAIKIHGGYLTNNTTNVNIKLISSNSKFKFTTGNTSGAATWESGSVTTATYDQDIYIVYTPNAYNTSETATITVQAYTFGGTTPQGSAQEITVYGRSLPETFVLALKTADGWVAVPADMIPPYGGCTTGVGTHDPYPIMVDNATTPTNATTTPTRAVYKGAARNTPTEWPWTVQFESNTQTGYMLWGSKSASDLTTIANQNYEASQQEKWNLITSDNTIYQLHLDATLNENKLGYNSTAKRIGQYKAGEYVYDFRILPIVGDPCVYYINPVMTRSAYNATTTTISIPYDGTTNYEYSIDGKISWTAVVGSIDCKTLSLEFANSTVKGHELWLRAAGTICNGDATSVEAMHMLNPSITATTPQEFNGVQNVAFNGEFAITTTDIWNGDGGGVQVASSNDAISASYNSTTGKVELSMAATSAGDYTTTLTISSVGATSQTVNVTIHIQSLATMTITSNGPTSSGDLLCNASTETYFEFAVCYQDGNVITTTDFTGYSLTDLATGTDAGNFKRTLDAGAPKLNLTDAIIKNLIVGHTYRVAWSNPNGLTNSVGLEYAPAQFDFIYTTSCDAPTALPVCITSDKSALANWVLNETCSDGLKLNVYKRNDATLKNYTFTSAASSTAINAYSKKEDAVWSTGGTGTNSKGSTGYPMTSTNGANKLYSPIFSNWKSDITATDEVTITIEGYNNRTDATTYKLLVYVVDAYAASGSAPSSFKSVKINGESSRTNSAAYELTLAAGQKYSQGTFVLSGVASTDRFYITSSASAAACIFTSIEMGTSSRDYVSGYEGKDVDGKTEQEISGLEANTTYCATISCGSNESNEVSFKTYATGEKSLTFKDGDDAVTETTILGGAGQYKEITIAGTKLAGCDITTSISAGYSVDESNLTFNHTTGALTGTVVFTLTDPAVTEGTYTITDGAGTVYTLNLTSTNCPAGFNTMATAANGITANSANANWTSSVTSNAGTLVLYKNGSVDKELIENGGFESDLTGWNEYTMGAYYGCDEFAISTTNKHDGSKCLKVTKKGSDGFTGMTGYTVIYANHMTLEAGTYRMSAWVKVDSDQDGHKDDFKLAFTGGGWNGSKSQPQTVFAQSEARTVLKSEGYVQLTAELTLSKSQACHPVVAVYPTTGTFRTFYLDDVSLVRISAAQSDEPYMNYDVASLSTGTLALSGLSGNTEYAYQIVNADGCESNVITFHTSAAGEPQITAPASVDISAPIGSTNSGVVRVSVTDAYDVVNITKCDDDRITLDATTLPTTGGVIRFTFCPKNTDSPGDAGTCTVSLTTRGKSVPVTFDINWSVSAGVDLNTELIEVTDISNSEVTVEHNVPGTVDEVRVVFNRELEPDEIEENVGDEIFFSKYYEAYMHKKLWAIYNPTMRKISLEGMQVWRSTSTGWNTDYPMDLSGMGKEAGFISPFEEIIIYTSDQVGPCEEAAADMTEWTPKSSSDPSLSFSGDDALLLVRKVSAETAEKNNVLPASSVNGTPISWPAAIVVDEESWHPLDIIGARTEDWKPDASACYKWNWTNCKTDVSESGDEKGWVGYGFDMSDNKSNYSACTGGGYLLSTNRCLLVRRMDVKSGANALAMNIGNMETLNNEWKGSHVPLAGNQADVSCENFSYVGGYDYAGYYNHYTPMNESEYINLGQKPDGTWSFEVNVPSYYCKNLRIEVVEKQTINGVVADNVHAYTDYKVPIVVEVNKNTTELVSGALTSTICSECDVVIRDAATLSHVSGGQGQFRDMYVYPGAKLSNEAKQTINLRSIYMQAENDNVSYAIINNQGSAILSDKVIHTKRIDNAYWYTFSLPYDCKIASIRQYNGKSLGKYEGPGVVNPEDYGDWTIKYYDGEARQTEGTSGAAGEASQFWKEMPANGTLKANQAYIIGMYTLANQHKVTVLFPPTEETPYTESGDDAKTTKVVNWASGLTNEKRHHGWNFVGSPYISMFNETADGEGLYNSSVVMKGKLEGVTYTDVTHVYVSIPNGGNSRTYTQALASATKLKPFTGYFVQVVDPTGGSSEEKTLTYSKDGRTLSAPARTAGQDKNILANLEIKSEDGMLHDNAGVVVDSRYDNTYNIGGDLVKMYAEDGKPQLYMLDSVGDKMAYLGIAPAAVAYIPMGLYVPTDGNYTLHLDAEVSSTENAEHIYLLHDGATVADLLTEDYIISANSGAQQGYSISIVYAPKVATDLNDVMGAGGNGLQVEKFLWQDHIYIRVGERIYDVNGREVKLVNAK